ncbi:MAG TPA: hypothetical protein VFW09_15085 [Solirubrobacteraceae bacterium]|nr:hypothetical protein [Solirubrobacteraceae bacterium]
MGANPLDAAGASDDRTPVSFLGRRLPRWVQLHLLVLPPGCTHPFEPGQWRGALIIVERGAIELELRSGRRVPCAQGYIGTLSGLTLIALHNPGARSAVITGVSRAADAERATQAQPAPGTSTSAASNCPLAGPEPGAPP